MEDIPNTFDYYRTGYIPELSGLRGLAVLFIMLFHAQVPNLGGAFIGVDIFFVLSGFLITRILIQEFDRFGHVNLKNFYIRRILRLGPALITLLFTFCLFSFILLPEKDAHANYIEAIVSLVYFTNWARAFLLYSPGFLSHTWSLSMEEQFYILWPILLLLLLRTSKRRSQIVIIAIIIAMLSWCVRIYLTLSGAAHDRIFFGLDTRADALMIGCALGIVLSSGLITKRVIGLFVKMSMLVAPVSLECIVLFAIFAYWTDPKMYLWGFVVTDLLTVILILDIFINPRSIIAKMLASKWLVSVGTISYGLYLWHFPIYTVMQLMDFNYMSVATVGSLFSLFVSATSYYLLENPILKYKQTISRYSV